MEFGRKINLFDFPAPEEGALYRIIKSVKRIVPIILALVAIGAFWLILSRNPKPAQIGTQAPDFTIKNSDKTVTLSQFRGKTVVLNFWATWCPPCVEEVPSLVQMQKTLDGKVVVVAVSMDVDAGAYHQFVAKNMPGVLTLRDGDQRTNALFGTYAFPETYVIDKNGIIRRKFIGATDWMSPEILDYLSKIQ